MTSQCPRDPEAERATLAASLVHPAARRFATNDAGVTPGHFELERHQRLFAAMLDLDDHGDPVDQFLVARKLGVNPDTLDDLIASAPAVANIPGYAKRVVAVAERRRKWIAAQELLAALEREDDDATAAAEGQLVSATRSDRSVTAEQLGSRVFDWLSSPAPAAIPSGFPMLDRKIGGGLRLGDTTVIAGWTSHGKSALVDSILTFAARQGHRCHAYVNEMSDIDRGLRMVARETHVPFSRLIVKNLDQADLAEVVQRCGDLPFGLTDCAGWTADQVARDIRSHRWDLAVVDLLHNMPHRDEKELSGAIVTLAASALHAGTHLLVVCQLNDARATAGRLPPPVMRDIRGSNMIRNVAATVLLLNRDQEEPEPGEVVVLPAGALVAGKARHGQIGASCQVVFDHRSMSFREPFGGVSV